MKPRDFFSLAALLVLFAASGEREGELRGKKAP